MRPYLNKVWVAEFDGLCSAEFLVFPKIEGLNNRFFAYRLNSQDFVNFANHQISGDRPRVNFDKVARFHVLLPPSREQDRIVAKLDAMLSEVDAGEAAARGALDRLQRYRAAVLHAAVTGDLTSAWRTTHSPQENGAQLFKRLLSERRARWENAEFKRLQATGKPIKGNSWKKRYPKPNEPRTSELPAVPENWKWASADQLTDATRAITYGIIKLGINVARGVPVLRSSNVRRLELDLDKLRRVPAGDLSGNGPQDAKICR
jgi:type I restriction enzyme S subunit